MASVLAVGASTVAQTPSATTFPEPRTVAESPLKTYLLPDKDGELQAVLGFTYEDFLELYKIREGMAPRDVRPVASLQQVTVQGTVIGDRAELDIQLRLLLREDAWTSVPLALGETLLVEAPRYVGEGDQFIEFQRDGRGYVLWLRGTAAGQHQVSIKVLAPVKMVGAQHHIQLALPRATRNELRLSVEQADAVGEVSEGSTLQSTVQRSGKTEFTVITQGGDLKLTWRQRDDATSTIGSSLEVEHSILTRIERGTITTEGILGVRSFGAPLQRFVVRLPRDASLVPEAATGYSISEIGSTGGPSPIASGDDRRRLVEVRLAQKTAASVDVRITATRPCDISKPNGPLEISGFEVVDAAREYGHVAVTVPPEWQLVWENARGVRRVDAVPESLRRENLAAGFAIDVASYVLTARPVPKRTRITVEPEYVVLVAPDSTRLVGRLNYAIRGAKVFELQLDMAGWELTSVGPENQVNMDTVIIEDDGRITVPLNQPVAGKMELAIEALRDPGPNSDRIVVPLPRPSVDSVGPAAVVISATDNLLLISDDDETVGLIRHPVTTTIPLPDRQWEPLRYRADTIDAVFTADIRRQPQEIRVESVTEVTLQAESAKVQQRLLYSVRNEPVDHLILDVPNSLWAAGGLEFLFEGVPLRAVVLSPSAENPTSTESVESGETAAGDTGSESGVVSEQPPSAVAARAETEVAGKDDSGATPGEIVGALAGGVDGEAINSRGTVRLRLNLPQARLGTCEITAQHEPAWSKPHSDGERIVAVRFVLPSEQTLRSSQLTVYPNNSFTATVASSTGWSRGASTSNGFLVNDGGQSWHRDDPPDMVELAVRSRNSDRAGTVVVERAWIRTYLRPTGRQDRLVMTVATSADDLRVIIPEHCLAGQVFVRNGEPDDSWRRSEWSDNEDGSITIPIPPGGGELRRVVIEVQCYSVQRQTLVGDLSIELPGVEDDVWVRRLYWQLVLPRSEHPVTGVRGLTPEYAWGWTGVSFSRRSTMNQQSLEAWSGGLPEVDSPTGVNSYLFSALGNVRRCELRSSSRSWMVLIGSGGVLVVGLLLLYVPVFRHPVVLMFGGVGLVTVGAIFPEPTLLFAQAAALGLLLVIVAVLLRRGMSLRRPLASARSLFKPDGGSTATQVPSPVRAPSSTRLAPVAGANKGATLPSTRAVGGPGAELPRGVNRSSARAQRPEDVAGPGSASGQQSGSSPSRVTGSSRQSGSSCRRQGRSDLSESGQ